MIISTSHATLEVSSLYPCAIYLKRTFRGGFMHFDRSFLLSKHNFDILWFNDNFPLDNFSLKKLPTLPMKCASR